MAPGTPVPLNTAAEKISSTRTCQTGNMLDTGSCDIWAYKTGPFPCTPVTGDHCIEVNPTDVGMLDTQGNRLYICDAEAP
jgi:hypothetical protein